VASASARQVRGGRGTPPRSMRKKKKKKKKIKEKRKKKKKKKKKLFFFVFGNASKIRRFSRVFDFCGKRFFRFDSPGYSKTPQTLETDLKASAVVFHDFLPLIFKH
jgi:hypothetical protein